MIGETVIDNQGSRNIWLVWMLMAGALIAGDFALKEHHLLVLALAPLGVGLAVMQARRPPLILHFREDGIEVESPAFEFIRYESIEALTAGREPGSQFSIAIRHRNGSLNIPPHIDFDSRKLFRFLRDELPEEESIGPPPSLRRFVQLQDEQFGRYRVFVYRSLADPRIAPGWMGVFVSLALLVVSILWMVIGGISETYRDWASAGVILCVGAVICLIVFLANRGSTSGLRGDGGVVIAPAAIAVAQGNLLGKMRWNEIVDIEPNRNNGTIRIHFHGGILTIHDIYHCPIRYIYRRLMDYWEGPSEE